MNCNTPNCKNKDWEGTFIGNLCTPCHQYYTEHVSGKEYSQAGRNHIAECKEYLRACEIYIINEKYK